MSEYVWNIENLPIWFQIELSRIEIKQNFTVKELTGKQAIHLNVLLSLLDLVEKGRVIAEVKDGVVRYHYNEGEKKK